MNLLVLSVLLCCKLSLLIAVNQKVVCYWPNWHMHAKVPYRNTPEDIDPSLCTHIHYSFAILDETHEIPKDSAGSPQEDVYKRLNALKHKNKDLKIILSLGGWGDDGGKYSRISASSEKRKIFTTNAIQYLHKYGFDGLDIDWEFPVCWLEECNKGHEADKANFGILLEELRVAFDKQTPKLSLSTAVKSLEYMNIANQAYDFKALGTYTDYINVMTYDNRDASGNITTHHSSLEDAKASLEFYHSKGVPKDKLLIGVAFYGRTFALKDPKNHKIGAPVTASGIKIGSGESGGTNYLEICNLVKTHGWTKEQTNDGHNPIAYHENQWVGYDDPNQAYLKSKFSKDNGYGGVLLWEISQDDITKKCCKVSYPMLKAINYGLYGTGENPSTYGCE